jgi:hypothetical protein
MMASSGRNTYRQSFVFSYWACCTWPTLLLIRMLRSVTARDVPYKDIRHDLRHCCCQISLIPIGRRHRCFVNWMLASGLRPGAGSLGHHRRCQSLAATPTCGYRKGGRLLHSALPLLLRLGTHEPLNDVRCRNIFLYIIAHTRETCLQQYNSTTDVI